MGFSDLNILIPIGYIIQFLLRRFARSVVMSNEQVSEFLAISAEVMSVDAAKWQRTAPESLAHFSTLLENASVERPPRSRGVFEPSTAIAIMDYMLQMYYRHYKLYKYCLSSVPDGQLVQSSPGEVIPPVSSKPLGDAILISKQP